MNHATFIDIMSSASAAVMCFGPTTALTARIKAGETADVAILTREGADELAGLGILDGGSIVDLVRSTIGLAVKAGAPRPDIGTAEAFQATLLAARHEEGVPATTKERAIDHLAFVVTGLDAAAAALRQQRVAFVEEPGVPAGGRTAAADCGGFWTCSGGTFSARSTTGRCDGSSGAGTRSSRARWPARFSPSPAGASSSSSAGPRSAT